MANSDTLRHQMLIRLTAQHAENAVDAAVNLWQSMATEIMALIGVTGFNSLYARSIFLTHVSFPWLELADIGMPIEQHFAELRLHLQMQPTQQAIAANHLLLMTFTDLFAKLIGEKITASILLSAWGSQASYLTNKEQQHG